jgi:hypothetical protein
MSSRPRKRERKSATFCTAVESVDDEASTGRGVPGAVLSAANRARASMSSPSTQQSRFFAGDRVTNGTGIASLNSSIGVERENAEKALRQLVRMP